MKTLRRTWAQIDLDHLEHNYRAIRANLPSDCAFLGVMKADAYGHGAVPVSSALTELGAEYLAVSNLDEAVQIRRGGIRTPILILGYTPPEYADTLVFMDITQEVHSLAYAKELDAALAGTNYRLNVHLKLDTGMTRLGFFAYGESNELADAEQVARLEHLHIEGIFTHFCAADSLVQSDAEYTRTQFQRYIEAIAQLEAAGIRPEIRHCANSGAALLHPEYALDMARAGIALYGLLPSADCAEMAALKPVMSLHTSIAQIRDIPAGCEVSYGRTFRAEHAMRIAVLPIGYADGLPRSLSSNASFSLHGQNVPIIGRICMDMCMVDITGVDAKQGDTLTLFGYDEAGAHIPCEALAEKADTIGYELLCAVGKRIPRIYIEGGKQSEILQYIV